MAEGAAVNFLRLIEPSPDHTTQGTVVTGKQSIRKIVGRPGFAGGVRDLLQTKLRVRRFPRPRLEGIDQAGVHLIGRLWPNDSWPGMPRLRAPHNRAVFFLDALENVQDTRPPAAIGKDGVSQGQFRQRHFAAAQESGRIRTKRRTNAGVLAKFQDVIQPRIRADADGRAVLRSGQGLARSDDAFVAILLIFRSPLAQDASGPADHDRAIVHGRVVHRRSRIISVLKRRRVDERFHGRAGRPPRLRGPVVLVVLEIAPAHEHEHSARLVIQRQDRTLQIFRGRLTGHGVTGLGFLEVGRVLGIRLMVIPRMLLGLVQVLAQGILRHLLQIGVDRCVNAKPLVHSAVPADRSDDLLPDVVHRIGLSLGILPAADGHVLSLRARAFLPVDESQIAHAGQCKVPGLTRCRPVTPRRQPVRALDQARERGAFRQGHLPRRLGKIAA